MTRLRACALAAALHCQQAEVDHARASQPARLRMFHPVEIAVGTVLSWPLAPADIDPDPHPLRFGWRYMPQGPGVV